LKGALGTGNNAVVTDYEGLIQSLLVPFLDAVNGVGGEVQQQGAYVAQVLGAQREMLVQVARMPQPSEDDFMEMLQSTNEALALVDECNEVLSLSMQRGSLPLGLCPALESASVQHALQSASLEHGLVP